MLDPAASSASGRTAWWSWLAISLLSIAAVAVAAAYLPAVVKKLGLFAAAYGLVCGWIAARLASRFQIRGVGRSYSAAALFFLVLAGQAGMSAESFRIDRAIRQRRLAADPKTASALHLFNAMTQRGNVESRKEIEEARQTLGATSSFRDFLEFRVSALGARAQRYGAAIWICEVFLASAVATWMFCHLFPERGREGPAEQLDADAPPAKLD